jgi:hypothetical protein
MTPLERRYRRLLLAYPLEYRRDHESEMLGTLLEAASPHQRWPSAREGAALLVGGLRTQARFAAGSPERIWTDGLRLGALLLLFTSGSELTALSLVFSPVGRMNGALGHPEAVHLEAVLSLAAVVALLRSRYRVGLCAVAGMLTLELMVYRSSPPVVSPLSALPAPWVLVGVVIAVLASRPSLRGRSHAWSWRLALLLLVALVPATLAVAGIIWSAGRIGGQLLSVLGLALEVVPAAVAIGIALLARDARFALAATLYVASDLLGRLQTLVVASQSVYFPRGRYLLETLMILLVGGGLTALSVVRTRRSATG